MRAIQLHLTSKNFKIITMYRLESWSYILSRPVFILPIGAEVNELSDKIHLALNESKELLVEEEDEFRIGSKMLLKELKESSFDKFYRASKSCAIYINAQKIVIEPYHYAGKNEGLTVDVNAVRELYKPFAFKDTNTVIIELLRQINFISK